MKKKVKLAAGLTALAVIGGTLAYFSKEHVLVNPLETKAYGGSTVEKFTPRQDFQPGDTVDKEVWAKNTGDYPVMVRVQMNEVWTREDSAAALISHTSKEAAFNSAALTDGAYFAAQIVGDNAAVDGIIAKDGTKDDSVVHKEINLTANTAGGRWVAGTDGYWYWSQELKKGETTEPLLKSLTMAANADMGNYAATEYYVVIPNSEGATKDNLDTLVGEGKKYQWSPLTGAIEEVQVAVGSSLWRKDASELQGGYAGYADAKYELTISTDIVQANADALKASGWPAAVTGVTYPEK